MYNLQTNYEYIKESILKNAVKSALRIGSAHNKGGPGYKYCPNLASFELFLNLKL